jgi:hypothetical protein
MFGSYAEKDLRSLLNEYRMSTNNSMNLPNSDLTASWRNYVQQQQQSNHQQTPTEASNNIALFHDWLQTPSHTQVPKGREPGSGNSKCVYPHSQLHKHSDGTTATHESSSAHAHRRTDGRVRRQPSSGHTTLSDRHCHGQHGCYHGRSIRAFMQISH